MLETLNSPASLSRLQIPSIPKRFIQASGKQRSKDEPETETKSSIDVDLFHKEADAILEEFCTAIDDAYSHRLDTNFDCTYHEGILSVKLGKLGTYVLNKQTPNRQIWFSSPMSGPKRYNFDSPTETWKNTRDGHELRQFLSEELSKLTGIQINLTSGPST
jgi:frataxin